MRRVLWLVLVCVSLTLGGIVSAYGIVGNNLAEYKGDWFIFWFVSQAPIDLLYRDFTAYPFPYPPTALFLVKPFAAFPVWDGLVVWCLLGLGALALASRHMGRAFLIALGMPAIMFCLVAGQTGLFVGSLILGGIFARDERLGGVLLGVAAALKPQALMGAAVALIASRDWKRAAYAVAGGIGAVLLGVLTWGADTWVRWLNFLPAFQAAVKERHVDQLDVGTNGLAAWLGLSPSLYLFGLVIGTVSILLVWSRSENAVDRFAALGCGTVLMSPYTLSYDLSALSIAAAAILFDQRRSPWEWVFAGWLLSGLLENIAIVGLAVVLVLKLLPDMGRAATVAR